MTYPMYLIHQNIGYILIESLQPYVGPLVVRALLVGALLAFTTWLIVKFVEQPLAPRIRALLAPKARAPTGHATRP